MRKLEGKVAIVTGSAHGIGRATAHRFAVEGASVIIADIDTKLGNETKAAFRAAGLAADYQETDVANGESIRDLVDSTVSRLGRIDILVNNAFWSAFGQVTDLSEKDWNRTFATGPTAVFLGCKYTIPHMQRQGEGWIVNVGSIFGLVAGRKRAAYCSTKAAVINLTRNMALDYIGDNIRVNCVCPGGVTTKNASNNELKSLFWQQKQYPESLTPDERLRMHPIGRQGTPEEIADAIMWLVDPFNKFTVGSALVIDGGLTAQSLI